MADDSTAAPARTQGPGGARSTQQRAQRGFFASIGLFFRQILDELRKVVRPTRSEWLTYTAVVIVFVTVIMLFVFGLDTIFQRLVSWVLVGS